MRRTARARNRKVGRKFHTIPLKGNSVRGNGEDAGKYFRCSNCGFICNIDRDVRGRTMNSVGAIEYVPNTYPTEGGLQAISVLGGIGNSFVSSELAADGTAQTLQYSFIPVISGGCPLCGTQNYDGNF